MAHPKLLGQQLMHRLHVVADGGNGKARAVEGFRRVAGRRGAPIAKQLRGDEELACGIEGFSRSNQPVVTTHIGHVVRRQKNSVVSRRVQMAIGAIDNLRFGQRDTALGMKVVNNERVLDRLGFWGRRLG
jgi:hypothetical protein